MNCLFSLKDISDLISGYKEEENEESLDRELEIILENEIQLPEVPHGVPDGKIPLAVFFVILICLFACRESRRRGAKSEKDGEGTEESSC